MGYFLKIPVRTSATFLLLGSLSVFAVACSHPLKNDRSVASVGTETQPNISPDDPEVMIRDTDPNSVLNQGLPASQRPKGEVFSWIQSKNNQTLAAVKGFKIAPSDAVDAYSTFESESEALQTASSAAGEPILYGNYAYQFTMVGSDPIWRRSQVSTYGKNAETLIDFAVLSANEKRAWSPEFDGSAATLPMCRLQGTEFQRCLLSLTDHAGNTALQKGSIREYDLKTKSFTDFGLDVNDFEVTQVYYPRWIDDESMVFIAHTDSSNDSLTQIGMPRVVQLKKRNRPAVQIFEVPRSSLFLDVDVISGSRKSWILVREHVTTTQTHYTLIDPKTHAQVKLGLPEDLDFEGVFHGQFLALVHKPWDLSGKTIEPGSLVSMPLTALENPAPLNPSSVVSVWSPTPRAPGSRYNRDLVSHVSMTENSVFLSVLDNVQGKLLKLSLSNSSWKSEEIEIPGLSSAVRGQIWITGMNVRDMAVFGLSAHNKAIIVQYEDYITPSALYFISESGAHVKMIEQSPPLFDSSTMNAEQKVAVSKDGTEIPYFVVRLKNISLDGSNPTVLYGYGCQNQTQVPAYAPSYGKMWVARGGVYVEAVIRGGGEFGPLWNQDGELLNKQNAFDDFASVAKTLIKTGVSSPARLGVKGVSCGGLLASAIATQHPELFAAVKSEVGIHDVLNILKFPMGEGLTAFLGDPRDPQMSQAMAAYSPYQNVSANQKYPTIFYDTRTYDNNVFPAQSRRMALHMGDLGYDVYFYEDPSTSGSHTDSGTPEGRIREKATEFSFFWKYLSGFSNSHGD